MRRAAASSASGTVDGGRSCATVWSLIVLPQVLWARSDHFGAGPLLVLAGAAGTAGHGRQRLVEVLEHGRHLGTAATGAADHLGDLLREIRAVALVLHRLVELGKHVLGHWVTSFQRAPLSGDPRTTRHLTAAGGKEGGALVPSIG